MSDLIKRISNAKGMIEKKPNQSTVDYTIYGVLTDCDITLKSQQAEIERLQPKKGKWQPYKFGDDTWHQCTACGIADRYIDIVERPGYPTQRMERIRNFCPYCGADMRKDD